MYPTILTIPGVSQMEKVRTATSVTLRCPACAVTQTYTYEPDASAHVDTFPHDLGCALKTRVQAALAKQGKGS